MVLEKKVKAHIEKLLQLIKGGLRGTVGSRVSIYVAKVKLGFWQFTRHLFLSLLEAFHLPFRNRRKMNTTTLSSDFMSLVIQLTNLLIPFLLWWLRRVWSSFLVNIFSYHPFISPFWPPFNIAATNTLNFYLGTDHEAELNAIVKIVNTNKNAQLDGYIYEALRAQISSLPLHLFLIGNLQDSTRLSKVFSVSDCLSCCALVTLIVTCLQVPLPRIKLWMVKLSRRVITSSLMLDLLTSTYVGL